MTLDQWRKNKGHSYKSLAAMLGASHATVVRRWCMPFAENGRMIPAPKFMMRILDLTRGEVQPNDFYIQRDR